MLRQPPSRRYQPVPAFTRARPCRKLAREFGVELAQGRGQRDRRGRIVKEDLHRFVQDVAEAVTVLLVQGRGQRDSARAGSGFLGQIR